MKNNSLSGVAHSQAAVQLNWMTAAKVSQQLRLHINLTFTSLKDCLLNFFVRHFRESIFNRQQRGEQEKNSSSGRGQNRNAPTKTGVV